MEIETSDVSKTEQEALLLHNVSFSYRTHGGTLINVLKEINLNISYGQIIGLVGLNASGKSTLLHIIRGFLIPEQGEVIINKCLIAKDGKLFKVPRVALVSQYPIAALSPSMTLFENYLLTDRHDSGALKWAYSKDSKSVCTELVRKANMGLEKKLDEQVRFLSGGQQQAFSVLLANRESSGILLLDEPTAALDFITSISILSLAVKETKATKGVLILVSHRVKEVLKYCDRLLVLKNKTIMIDVDLNSTVIDEKDLLGMLSEENGIKFSESKGEFNYG